jgi:hypothetical protein
MTIMSAVSSGGVSWAAIFTVRAPLKPSSRRPSALMAAT